jgi:hypothetical protein
MVEIRYRKLGIRRVQSKEISTTTLHIKKYTKPVEIDPIVLVRKKWSDKRDDEVNLILEYLFDG